MADFLSLLALSLAELMSLHRPSTFYKVDILAGTLFNSDLVIVLVVSFLPPWLKNYLFKDLKFASNTVCF